jgi:hypothetical protein
MVIRSSLCPKCNGARLDAEIAHDELRLMCPLCGWDFYPQARPEPKIIYEDKVVYRDRVVKAPITKGDRRRITIEELERHHLILLQERAEVQALYRRAAVEYAASDLQYYQILLYSCLWQILKTRVG